MATAPINLWAQAAAALPRSRIPIDLIQLDANRIIERVLESARHKQDECREYHWKYNNHKGEAVILHDVLAKVIAWIGKFKQICDAVGHCNPRLSTLPWAGICLLLEFPLSNSHTFGKIAEEVEWISKVIARYAVVETLYLQNFSATENILKETLLELYKTVLVYIDEVIKSFDDGSLQLCPSDITASLFNGSRERVDLISSILQTISKDSTETPRAQGHSFGNIQISDSARVQMGDQYIENHYHPELEINTYRDLVAEDVVSERLKSVLADFEKPIIRTATQLAEIRDFLEDHEREKIFDWLSMVPYRKHHVEKRKLLLPGSCGWLFAKAEFIEWRMSSVSSILWLHGIPGSGKSMLVSSVIERLHQDNVASSSPAPIAYFYCARNAAEPERGNPDEILRCILDQLSSSTAELPIRPPVLNAYLKAKSDNRGRKPGPLELNETVGVILQLLEENPATVIIDALDECDPRLRNALMLALSKLIQNSANLLKVFVSSRDDQDIVCCLANSPNLYISAADNNQDIQAYVCSEVSQAIKEQRILNGNVSKEMEQSIVSNLISKANGMFRLVSLHIQTLCDPYRVKTEENVYSTLGRLPKELNQSYDLIFDQIHESEQPNPDIAARVLKWLMCLKRTLSTSGFIEAISVNALGEKDCANLTISNVLSICCNLVVHDSAQGLFRFAHLSVREYLADKGSYSTSKTHSLAFERSIYSFFRLRDSKGSFETEFEYYSWFWGDHYFLREGLLVSETLLECLKEFFYNHEATPSFVNWITHSENLKGFLHQNVAAATKHLLTNYCLQRSGNNRQGNIQYQDENSDAIANRSLLQMLIFDRDVSIYLGWWVRHLIPIAAKSKNLFLVRLLLKKGADLDGFDNRGFTALNYALENEHKLMFFELLGRGASIRLKDGAGMTLLHQAAKLGYNWAVSAFLKKGIEVDIRDKSSHTALMTACAEQHEDTVKLLLEGGASVNSVNYEHKQALHIAVATGNAEILQQLVHYGAEVNFRDYRGRTALHHAAQIGSEALAQLLIANGGNFTIKDHQRRVPIEIAAEKGHVAIVSLLLQLANPDSKHENLSKALVAAIEGAQTTVVQELINAGEDITAFQTDAALLEMAPQAEEERHIPIIQLLVSTRPNIDSQNDVGQTLLHHAAGLGYTKFVEILLRYRASVGIQDSNGETAIIIAAKAGHIRVVQLLLEKNANVEDTVPISRYTALHKAAEKGHLDVVKLLVERGADVNAELSGGETAAILACERHQDVFNFLVQLM